MMWVMITSVFCLISATTTTPDTAVAAAHISTATPTTATAANVNVADALADGAVVSGRVGAAADEEEAALAAAVAGHPPDDGQRGGGHQQAQHDDQRPLQRTGHDEEAHRAGLPLALRPEGVLGEEVSSDGQRGGVDGRRGGGHHVGGGADALARQRAAVQPPVAELLRKSKTKKQEVLVWS